MLTSLLLQPFLWALAVLVVSLLVRTGRLRRWLAGAALAVLLLFSNPRLHFEVSKRWEPAPRAIADLGERLPYAAVLGGFTRLHGYPPDRLHLNSAANRFAHAVELYHAGKVERLVFVSGARTASDPELSEAELAARAAERFGVPSDRVFALSTSRNTHDNAKEFAAFLETEGRSGARVLLVTSVSHLRRAEACFRKQGIAFESFPTDHRSNRDPMRRQGLLDSLLPSAATLAGWSELLHEWVGLAAYRLRGRI